MNETKNKNENDKVKDETCRTCKKEDSPKGKGENSWIQCDKCEHWYHFHCEGISQEQHDKMKTIEKQYEISWKCKKCKSAREKKSSNTPTQEPNEKRILQKMNELFLELAALQLELQKSQYALKSSLEEIAKEAIKDNITPMQKKLEDIETRLFKLETPTNPEHDEKGNKEPGTTEQTTDQINWQTSLNEILEREKRKDSIVIFGIEDPSLNDTDKITNWIRINVGSEIRSEDIKQTTWIGKETQGKIRPLRVKLHNIPIRNEILKNAIQAHKKVEKECGKKIYINPDRTRQQRNEQEDLRKALKAKRAEGGQWIIKHNKIIRIFPEDQQTNEDVEPTKQPQY